MTSFFGRLSRCQALFSFQSIQRSNRSRELGFRQPSTGLADSVVNQTEDVLVDSRGNIFVTDKNWGLWVLRYSGPDQPAPTDR